MEIQAFCPLATYPSILKPRNFSSVRADPDYSPPDIPARYIEYPALPLLSRPLNGAVAARYVLPHLRRFQPDLILSYYVYPDGYAALSAGKRLGVPVILGAIGSDINRIPDRVSESLTRKALREASSVITVSEHLRAGAIQLGASPERTRAIRNGCDTRVFCHANRAEARIELGLAQDSEIVVFVGLLASTKGVRELMEAMIRLVPSRPNLQLFLIGEGPAQGSLQEQAAGAGIAEHVHFLGRRSSMEIARWHAASNLFCLPSYAEGCPNAVIEALSCGRPVVATSVGGIPELINKDNGVLCSARDAEALAKALIEALDRQWDEPGIASASQRGWEQVAKETWEVCCGVLDGSRSGRMSTR